MEKLQEKVNELTARQVAIKTNSVNEIRLQPHDQIKIEKSGAEMKTENSYTGQNGTKLSMSSNLENKTA